MARWHLWSRNPRVAPRLVVYDPELTYDLPPGVTADFEVPTVAALADPVGEIVDGWVRPNGLRIRRVRV